MYVGQYYSYRHRECNLLFCTSKLKRDRPDTSSERHSTAKTAAVWRTVPGQVLNWGGGGGGGRRNAGKTASKCPSKPWKSISVLGDHFPRIVQLGKARLPPEPVHQRLNALMKPRERVLGARLQPPPLPIQHPPTCVAHAGEPSGSEWPHQPYPDPQSQIVNLM